MSEPIMCLVDGDVRHGEWEIVWNPVGWYRQVHLRDLHERHSVGRVIDLKWRDQGSFRLSLSRKEMEELRRELEDAQAADVRALVEAYIRTAERSGLERDRAELNRVAREYDYHMLEFIRFIVKFADDHPDLDQFVLSMPR